jgi:DNA-directed RNA polymerase subunit beta'
MPKILDYKSFCEDLDEVTSLKTFGKKKFHPQGLFSEQIFGPIRNYTCQCGIYHGVSKSGGKCDICGVDIINSDSRRKRFAKITIPIQVVNPIFYDLLVDLAGRDFKKVLDDLMRHEDSILYFDNVQLEFAITTSPEGVPKDSEKWERAEAIRVLVETVAKNSYEEGVEEWKIVLDNIENLLMDQIIVLPPDLRPTSKSSGEAKQLMDKINRYYVQILTKKEIMRDTIIDIHRDKALYYTYFKQLQKDISELYTRILEKIAKKEGLIRGNILGKRIDFSGRAVITPDPTLNLEECKLPYLMILEIFKLPIAKRIIQLGKFKLLNKAIDFVDQCIDHKNPVLLRVCEEVTNGEYCILNRQPSLHKLGMLGFKIRVTLDSVIKIHPMACPPFNADFDGDQMAVYIPITDEAKEEIINKISIAANLSSPANESLTTTPSQDIILGIYYLTSPEFSDKTIKYRGKEILIGRAEFNSQLPKDYPVVDDTLRKKELMTILNDIKDKYEKEEVVDTLDNIKKIGFKYATLYGSTMSLKDFPIEGAEQIKSDIYAHDKIRNQLAAFSDPSLISELKSKFKYSYMIESGARGSWDQVKQLILSRGFISNFDGEILPHPIKNSLVDGLTQEEFFFSTYGCRKGLLDVALNTGTSGYLSRKLIFTCANLQIDKDLEDCGTEDLLEVDVKTERKAHMLVNRWCLNENDSTLYKITEDNYKNIVGKIIFIRSPILCKSPKICLKCYGDLYKNLNSRFIGIIAAQTLGERGTQLVLRTFHTSGSAVIKGEEEGDEKTDDSSMRQKDIIGDLASVADLLHKFKNKTHTMIVDQLFKVYDKDIHHVHFECVVAQLMWKNYKKWRLIEGREKLSPNFYSIQSVPNQESWILAMAFSNPKRSILQGILHEGRYSGVMDKILKGERIT